VINSSQNACVCEGGRSKNSLSAESKRLLAVLKFLAYQAKSEFKQGIHFCLCYLSESSRLVRLAPSEDGGVPLESSSKMLSSGCRDLNK